MPEDITILEWFGADARRIELQRNDLGVVRLLEEHPEFGLVGLPLVAAVEALADRVIDLSRASSNGPLKVSVSEITGELIAQAAEPDPAEREGNPAEVPVRLASAEERFAGVAEAFERSRKDGAA